MTYWPHKYVEHTNSATLNLALTFLGCKTQLFVRYTKEKIPVYINVFPENLFQDDTLYTSTGRRVIDATIWKYFV